jgi:carbon storage regulator
VLVLTRKSNQSIMIGDDIEVSVLSVVGEKVRIGIQAPQHVPVFRTEIYLEIQRQQEPTAERPVPAGDGEVRAEVEQALDQLGEPS